MKSLKGVDRLTRLCAGILTLYAAVGAIGASGHTFVLTVFPKSSANTRQVEAVVKRRMEIAGIRADTSAQPDGRLRVFVEDGPAMNMVALLDAPGNVVIRILPRGDIYAPGKRVVKSAHFGIDEMNQQAFFMTMANPGAYFRFTRVHLHKKLGIFVDGKMVLDADIVAPAGGTVEISNTNFSKDQALFLAAVMSAPLQQHVQVLQLPR